MHKSIYSYDRKTLYKEVWAEPMTIVSKRYEISNVGLKKICKKLNIPTPGVGYWAKVRAGYKIEKPSLPKYKGPKISNQPTEDLDETFFKGFGAHFSECKEKWGFEDLKSEALDWELANTIREYIQAVEIRVLTMRIPSSEKILIRKKIKWAKRKVDWLDPIIAAEDPILGKRRYKRLFFDKEEI